MPPPRRANDVPRGRGAGLALVLDEDRALAALWRHHRAERSVESRLALFDRYRVFARRLGAEHARRFGGLGLERADFDQLAGEALLQAIDRFDPDLAVPFEAFARLRIRGHIRNALDKASEASAQYGHRRRAERDRLRSLQDHGGDTALPPTAQLAAVATKLALGFIMEAASPEPDTLPTEDPSAYDTLAWRQLCGELDRRLATLPEKEAFVLDRHYRQGEQFQQIALLLGLSKGRVSQLHAQGLDRLRKQMARLR